MAMNVMSGIGVQRDQALRDGGVRQNMKHFNEGVERERALISLGSHVDHPNVVKGDLISIQSASAVPLTDDLPFAGVVEAIGEERGRYVVSVCTRGAICVRVSGLSSETRLRGPVYAIRTGGFETFSLDGPGTIIGELLAVESLERSMGIVGFKRADDARRFELGGMRPR